MTTFHTVALHLNYNPIAMHDAGIDPTTSEGKAKLVEFLLSAVADTGYTLGDVRSAALVKAFLWEGPA